MVFDAVEDGSPGANFLNNGLVWQNLFVVATGLFRNSGANQRDAVVGDSHYYARCGLSARAVKVSS